MKMIITIVRDVDDSRVIDQLVVQGYRVTRLASTGGFLRRGNVTLLIGVEDDSKWKTSLSCCVRRAVRAKPRITEPPSSS